MGEKKKHPFFPLWIWYKYTHFAAIEFRGIYEYASRQSYYGCEL